MNITPLLIRKFQTSYTVEPESGCWKWHGAFQTRHHPIISIPTGSHTTKQVYASHLAYTLKHGHIPLHARLRRICGQPDCVNPNHVVNRSHMVAPFQSCVVDGCGRAVETTDSDCCPGHERLWTQLGKVKCLPPTVWRQSTLGERFHLQYEEVESGCWYWRGRVNGDGFGIIRNRHHWLLAHRVSYMVHVGRIPDGKEIIQRCGEQICVSPHHIILE